MTVKIIGYKTTKNTRVKLVELALQLTLNSHIMTLGQTGCHTDKCIKIIDVSMDYLRKLKIMSGRLGRHLDYRTLCRQLILARKLICIS